MQKQDYIACPWYRPEYKSITCAYKDFYKCTVHGNYRMCPLRNELEKLEERFNENNNGM